MVEYRIAHDPRRDPGDKYVLVKLGRGGKKATIVPVEWRLMSMAPCEVVDIEDFDDVVVAHGNSTGKF